MNNYDAHKESIKGKVLTAYELADAMDTKGFRYREVKAAVKMLRQLQTENEELKAKIEGLNMAIWKLQTTITNRELRTYDGKLE